MSRKRVPKPTERDLAVARWVLREGMGDGAPPDYRITAIAKVANLARRLAEQVNRNHRADTDPCEPPCGTDACAWCFEVALIAEARSAGLLP